MVEVSRGQRIDDQIVLFKVKWTDSATNEWAATFVKVHADLDDISEDQASVPQRIRIRALEAAQEFLERFRKVIEEKVSNA